MQGWIWRMCMEIGEVGRSYSVAALRVHQLIIVEILVDGLRRRSEMDIMTWETISTVELPAQTDDGTIRKRGTRLQDFRWPCLIWHK